MLERHEKSGLPSPNLIVTGKRERFSRTSLQHLLDKVAAGGFVGCRIALSVYHERPYRAYREVPGQAIRFRVFNIRSLMEMLRKMDEVMVEVEND